MGPITAEVVEEKQRRDLRGRKIVDAQRRAELLAAYDASGLTQRRFARQEGINVHTFIGWLQAQRRSGGVSGRPRFQEIQLAGAAKRALLEVALPGGLIVRGDDAASVVELVRALRA